jgi:predicted dehydrogenase
MAGKIRVCIVGCGRISTLHALGYRDDPDAEIYAVCDVNAGRAKETGEELGVSRIYTKYDEVLVDKDIDMVELLVPHHLHCEMTVKACQAGKHVSVQKPMALTLEEADTMIAAAAKAKVKLKVYENFVFYPPLVKAKELIEAGEIGEPLSIRIKLNSGDPNAGWKVPIGTWRWRMQEKYCGGGPIVFDDGYHKFSVARFLMGDVEKVVAWIDHMTIVPGLAYADAPSVIMWKYRDGKKYGVMDVTFSKDLDMDTRYYPCDERFEVTGTKGVLWVTKCTANMLNIPSLILYKDKKTIPFTGLRDDWSDSFIDSTKDFISALKYDREAKLTGKDGREVLKFALAAIESSRTSREIHLKSLGK